MIVRKNKQGGMSTLIVTEEELTFLWHKLNAADGTPFKEYCIDYHLPGGYSDAYREMGGELWSQIDEKFRPLRNR